MTRQVIITGGATGIGRACAAEFVKAGDFVTITGRRKDLLEDVARELGAQAVSFDASDPIEIENALSKLPSQCDVLVNNAGGNMDNLRSGEPDYANQDDPSSARLEDVVSRWTANFRANVLTAVLVTEALKIRMPKNARIINIGSIAGRNGGGESYGACKASIEAWTAELARTLGPQQVTANVVSPGLVESTEFFQGTMTEERRTSLIEATFTKRAGRPEDIASVVFFLASRCASHLTGQVVPVNGGAHLAR